jgi:hypothetical protein
MLLIGIMKDKSISHKDREVQCIIWCGIKQVLKKSAISVEQEEHFLVNSLEKI